MLNGIDPIIIFQFYKNLPAVSATLATIPLTATKKNRALFAIIPIYLSETITGIYIDNESKNIDINTDPVGLTSGDAFPVNQSPLGSIVTVNLIGKRDSIGLTILLAMSELLLDKVVSQEYEVTYMHGAVNVFGGLIHSFSYDQDSNTDLFKLKLEIARGRPKSTSIPVPGEPTGVTLKSSGTVPPAGSSSSAPTPPAGSSISPGGRLP